MVNYSRRDRVHLKIGHLICTHHHSALLFAKRIDYLCQCVRTAVHIVTVKLNGILAAHLMMYSQIPASTNAKVGLHRHHMNEPVIFCSHPGKQLCGTVGRMIVHNNDVEWKITFLTQCTLHCILDSPYPVKDRNDDSSSHREILLSTVRFLEHRSKPASYPLEMVSTYLLHLHLYRSVLGIHIIELLLTGFSGIRLNLGIEIFVYMHNLLHAEPQVIKGAPLPILLHSSDSSPEGRPSEHQHTAEVKIITQCPFLTVNQRMAFSCLLSALFFHKLIMVGIQHVSTSVLRNGYDTIECEHAHFKRLVFGIDENIFLRHSICDASQCLCGSQRHTGKNGNSHKRLASTEGFHRHLKVLT